MDESGCVNEHHESMTTGPLSLAALADQLLQEAKQHSSRRAAATILSGPSMRATLIALAAGAGMAEHEAPPAATLQVVDGDVRLLAGEEEWPVRAGEVIAIPPRRHSVAVTADSVLLLTVALH